MKIPLVTNKDPNFSPTSLWVSLPFSAFVFTCLCIISILYPNVTVPVLTQRQTNIIDAQYITVAQSWPGHGYLLV